MIQTLLVFVGGGLGAACRHWVNIGSARAFGIGFPFGTVIINIVGSSLMGALAAWFAFRADAGLTQHMRLFLTTGILGGFTTFSAFSLDAVLLWERGEWGPAALYVILSVGLSLVGLVAGLALVRSFS